ncbi:MAG: zf-HC2 domain-containing protein [Bryobacteraceae bacterium]
MSCSPFDLRDYFFGELPDEARRRIDVHIKSCADCRDEVSRYRATELALRILPDEEIPKRIGFVSDRVYEPSRVRRWREAFWGSAPKLGFASAAMLSAALITSAVHRPAPLAVMTPVAIDQSKIQDQISREVAVAVDKALAGNEARNAKLLAAAERRYADLRKGDMETVSQSFAIMEKQVRNYYRASVEWK